MIPLILPLSAGHAIYLNMARVSLKKRFPTIDCGAGYNSRQAVIVLEGKQYDRCRTCRPDTNFLEKPR
jgi:hypothetical protein